MKWVKRGINKMVMDRTSKLWQTLLISSLTAIISGLFVWGIARGADKSDETIKKIEGKADIRYVDEKDKELKLQVDKKADKESLEEIKSTLKVMDTRIYEMWQKQQ
jgi:hypothetical protein